MTDDHKHNIVINILSIIGILGLASVGVYLVMAEHYGWAWIPFIMAVFLSNSKDDKNENNKG